MNLISLLIQTETTILTLLLFLTSQVFFTKSCRLYFQIYWSTQNLTAATAAAAVLLQSCLTLCDPIDGSPPGSPVPGILQARTLDWVAISFSNAWKWKVKTEKWKWSRSFVSDSSWPHGLRPTRLLRPWNFPGKSTGVGRHRLLWLLHIYCYLSNQFSFSCCLVWVLSMCFKPRWSWSSPSKSPRSLRN